MFIEKSASLIFGKVFIIFTFCFLLLPEKSYSQEDEEKEKNDSDKFETNEVVITGTRTPEKIIDIPYSVFKVDSKEMKFARNVSVKDILNDVPGLFLQSRYGSHDVRVSIRGYGTRSNSGIRGIRILQDGIPESEPDGETNIDAIDYTSLQTVEVAKGNLSSLYTNAPGGVINFISDLSFKNNYIKQYNEFGDYGLFQNGIKTGLITKNYKYFLSYMYRNFDGFRQHSNEYISIVNSIFQVYPDSRTTVSILGNYARGVVKLPGGLTLDQYNYTPYIAYPVAVSSDFKRDLQKGRIAGRYNTFWGKDNSNEVEITGYTQIKDFEFTTNTLYTLNTRYVLGTFLKYVNKSKVFSKRNMFSTGMDYNYVFGPISSYTNLNGIKGDELQAQNSESLNNLGIFIQNQLYFYKDVSSVFFSGRYDNIIIGNNNLLFGLQNSERRFSRFTPKLAFNYKLNPNIALYTSYGYAFDTPAAAELVNYPYSSNNGLTTLNPDLNPQKSKSFEFGIKGNVSDEKIELEKLFFEVTFFDINITDEIVPFIINDITYFRNAASTTRLGVETGFKLEMFEGMELAINYTYSDFTYDDYEAISYTSGGDTINENYSGNTVPSVPPSLVNFILNYEYKISKNVNGLVLFDMDYVGSMFVDDKNSASTSPYFYINGLIGANIYYKDFSMLISGGINNFLDKKYVGFINVNANPELPQSERRFYEPGEPTSLYLGINLGYTF